MVLSWVVGPKPRFIDVASTTCSNSCVLAPTMVPSSALKVARSPHAPSTTRVTVPTLPTLGSRPGWYGSSRWTISTRSPIWIWYPYFLFSAWVGWLVFMVLSWVVRGCPPGECLTVQCLNV